MPATRSLSFVLYLAVPEILAARRRPRGRYPLSYNMATLKSLEQYYCHEGVLLCSLLWCLSQEPGGWSFTAEPSHCPGENGRPRMTSQAYAMPYIYIMFVSPPEGFCIRFPKKTFRRILLWILPFDPPATLLEPSESPAGSGLSVTLVPSDASADVLEASIDVENIEEWNDASTSQKDVDLNIPDKWPDGEGINWDDQSALKEPRYWGDQSPIKQPSVARQPNKVLTWISPLSNPMDIPMTAQVAVNGQVYPFLTAFLFKNRKVDIPFPKRHGLARFLLSCAEKACYTWMHRWHPLHLELLGIGEADELELAWWLLLVKHLSIGGKLTHPAEASATKNDWCESSTEQIRHIAVHRLEYDTRVIRYVVDLTVDTNNSKLTRDIEQVLESLYIEECDNTAYHLDWLYGEVPQSSPDSLPMDAKAALDTALGLSPSIPRTPHEVLGRLDCILNNVCFNYAVARSEPWQKRSRSTEPCHVELHHWYYRQDFDIYKDGKFATEFQTCIYVRHSLEHKCGHLTELTWLAETLRDSKRFAAALDDTKAVRAIEELEENALPFVEVSFAARFLTLSERSESELRELAEQAEKYFKKWENDYQLEKSDYRNVIKRRYEASWRFYEAAADRKRTGASPEEGSPSTDLQAPKLYTNTFSTIVPTFFNNNQHLLNAHAKVWNSTRSAGPFMEPAHLSAAEKAPTTRNASDPTPLPQRQVHIPIMNGSSNVWNSVSPANPIDEQASQLDAGLGSVGLGDAGQSADPRSADLARPWRDRLPTVGDVDAVSAVDAMSAVDAVGAVGSVGIVDAEQPPARPPENELDPRWNLRGN